MPYIDAGDRSIELNNDGFLVHFNDWNKEVATALADRENLRLAHCHWEAIRYLRDFYSEFETNPSPRKVVKSVGERLTAGKCTTKTLDEIFPQGGCRQACRIAGLPHYYPHVC